MTNNMNITAKVTQAILTLIVSLSVTSCSTYPNKFKCGDAKGLGCTMLSEVDRQIDSGKIEQVYKEKKCKRGRCNSLPNQDGMIMSKKEKARLSDEEPEEILDDDNNLYF